MPTAMNMFWMSFGLRADKKQLALSEAESAALQNVSNEASAEPLVQEAEQCGHSQVAGSFCKFAGNLKSLVMLRWLSPVTSLLKVSGQEQHSWFMSCAFGVRIFQVSAGYLGAKLVLLVLFSTVGLADCNRCRSRMNRSRRSSD